MNFLEWVTQQYPEQFIPEKHFTFLLEAWNAGQAAEREKYAELIAAAEAVLSQMVVEIESTGQLMEWHTIACDVLERVKNERRL